jgi:hypothetical protein
MTLDPRVEQALKGPEPISLLCSLATALQASGQDQASIMEFFETNRRSLREQGLDAEEDAVMAVMDFLVGWCSPHVSLTSKKP